MPPNIVDLYYGHKFKCGCGKIHVLGPDIEVPRDLPMKKRFVAVCPRDENMMNLLKIKGIVRIAGVETIYYTKIETEDDYANFSMGMGRGKGLI